MHYRWKAVLTLSGAALVLGRLSHAAETSVTGPLVVRQNLRLQADVRVPPQGVGIRVAAPDVRIDLNGHQIEGDGTGIGIQIEDQTGCIVAGGTIRGCQRGVVILRGGSHRFISLSVLEQTSDGLQIFDSRHNEVTGCLFRGNQESAILVERGGSNRVIANRLEENRGPDDSGGITLKHTQDNLVRGNTLQGNGSWGLRLREGSVRNRVLNNQIADSGLPQPGQLWAPHPGLVLDDGATDNELRGNTLNGNSVGLFLWAGAVRNRIEQNVATGNLSLDVADLNPECGDNVWINNEFERSNRICE